MLGQTSRNVELQMTALPDDLAFSFSARLHHLLREAVPVVTTYRLSGSRIGSSALDAER